MLKNESVKWGLLGLSIAALLLLIPSVQSLFFNPLSFASSKSMVSVSVILCLTCITLPAIIAKFYDLKQDITSKSEKIHAISLGIFVIAVFCDLVSKKFAGDDSTYQLFLNTQYFPQFIKSVYYGWSSRLIIDTFLLGMVDAHPVFWMLFTTIAIVGIFESIVSIAFPKEKRMYAGFVYALFFLIPNVILRDAGWGTTTINYTWPLAAAMPTFLVFKKIILKEDTTLFEYAYSIVLLIYATNSEQVALIILTSCLLLIGYHFYTKIQKKTTGTTDKYATIYLCITLLICVAAIGLLLASPGNENRLKVEAANCFPEYLGLGFTDKIGLGLLTAFPFVYCSGFEYPLNFFIVLLTCLCGLLFYAKGNRKMLLLQVPVVLFLLIFNYLPLLLIKQGTIPAKSLLLFSNNRISAFSTFSSGLILAETIVYFALTALVLYTIYKSFESKQKSVVVCLILLAGFCSRIMMGFSSTVYASTNRPYIFLVVSLIAVSAFLFEELVSKETISLKYLGICLVAFVVLMILIHAAARIKEPVSAQNLYPKMVQGIK